jgi:predicted PurR-regulated permease PerM
MVRREGFVYGFSLALGAAVLALLLYLGWQVFQAALQILPPFAIATIFSILLDPLADRVQTKWTGGRRGPAVALVFLVFLLFFIGLIAFLVPNLVAQTGKLVNFFAPLTYTVEQTPSDTRNFQTVKEGITTTRYTARGLTNGARYIFRVTAADSDGQEYHLRLTEATPTDRPIANGEGQSGDDGLRGTAGSQAAPSPPPSPPATPLPTDPAASPSPPPLVSVSIIVPTPPPATPPGAVPSEAGAPVPSTVSTPASSGKGKSPSTTDLLKREAPIPDPGVVIAVPGDRQVNLIWRAPANAKSGFDRLREQVDAWLKTHRRIGPMRLPANLDTLQRDYADQFSQTLQSLAKRLGEAVVGSLATLLYVILIPIITYFILMDMDRLRARLLFLLPDRFRTEVLRIASDVGDVFGSYVRGMTIVSAAYGVVAFLLFLGLGLIFKGGLGNYALLLGVVAGLLYPVPYIGPTATTFLACIISLATGQTAGQTVIVLLVALAENQIFDNVVVPRIVGSSVGLHPLATMFALLLGGTLFGLWGMLLSVPIAGSIQVVLFRLVPKMNAPTPLSLLMPSERPAPQRDPPPREDRDSSGPPEQK